MVAKDTLQVIINSDTVTYVKVPATKNAARAPSDTGLHIQSPNPTELDSIKRAKTKGKE
jgi:hypothetical protein